ncbi:hypothetical protein ABE10_11405 [Bacillus toyonensis]|nr:hypothetical protein [Bacillus toyonensis]
MGGTVLGALIGLTLFLVLPADPGEGGVGVLVILMVIGALLGALTGAVSTGASALLLWGWTRRSDRVSGSRILVGVVGAVLGAALPSLGIGFFRALTDPYGFAGFMVFSWIAAGSVILAVPLSVILFAVAESRVRRRTVAVA